MIYVKDQVTVGIGTGEQDRVGVAEIARDKAYTVAAFLGIPTSRWFDMVKDAPAVREGIVHRDRLVIFAGGEPVVADGTTVGAVGVSGGSAEQDEEIAAVGAAALG